MNCSACAFDNPPGFRFCGRCGAALAEPLHRPAPTPSREVPSQAEAAAERRHLTVMFCDLVGSTALSERLDPEELREVVRGYQAVAGEAVERFGGQVAQYLGDGILAYFGYPIAHEDDARRAVLSGLAILRAVHAESRRFEVAADIPLQVRIGIHTGEVVAGEIGAGRERLAMGQTPNVAARVQDLAAPDTVVATAATYRLVQGFFDARPLGPQELKGVSQPVEIYQMLRESGVRNAFELAVARGLTPAVGRSRELEILTEHLERVREGRGQALLLVAEAGLGKSRLIRIFSDSATAADRWLVCRCSPFLENSAFSPIIELLENAFLLRAEDSTAERLRKLEEAVARFGMPPAEVVPLLASLLSIPLGEGFSSAGLSPQTQKKETLEILLRFLLRMAEEKVVVFVMEDLHWVDPSTLEFLDLLVRRGPEARILTLLTARPSFSPPWTGPSAPTRVGLDRLGDDEVARMVSGITVKALPPELLRQVVERTDGVPLFVEELTKMILESGLLRETADHYELAGPLPSRAIPTTLQDSLTARLDRLASARELAQVGATLGREFSYPLLAAVAQLAGPLLESELGRLVEAGLLYQRGTPPLASYVFKHALIQEVAYQSILSRAARQLHRRIAQVLEDNFPHVAEEQPEVVAVHFTRGGLTEKAIDYWQRAAERSIKNSANPEAIAHLTNCLELLGTLPETEERHRREMRLRIELAPPLIATKGYSAVEVYEELSRARDLCVEVGDDTELFRALRLLWTFQTVRGDHRGAGEAARQLVVMAEGQDAGHLRLEAYRVKGASLFYSGRLEEALKLLVETRELYDRQRYHSHILIYGQDPGVGCLSNESLTLWYMGYPERALARGAEALSLARDLAHPYSLCYSLFFCSWVYLFLRDLKKVHEIAEEMILVSRHQSFPFWETMGIILRGWVFVQLGETSKGVATMKSGIASWRRLGAGLYLPSLLSLVAEIHAEQGEVEAGLAAAEEGLEVLRQTGEAFSEPELYRLKGELLWVQSEKSAARSQEAEECLIRARETAARRASKFLELRASISLSRFWLMEGKRTAAREVLDETRHWFGEGSDTYDLRRADELRSELAE